MSDDTDVFDESGIEEIALIGLAGRFPGAENVEAFWQNLRHGVESISRLTEQELITSGVPAEICNRPGYVKARSTLKDEEMFDARFFGLTPQEAVITDPQHRIFLECAWEALENAGYNAESYADPIGVYAGAGPNHYVSMLPANAKAIDPVSAYHKTIGNEKDFLSTRVSHKLNLTGPSLTVQTGCSTSLVAVHLACQSLLNYQCSMALAGGVSIDLRLKDGYLYQEGMILSPDGHCRAFDAKAKGTVLGQGVAIVVLKRLSDARADGDNILAVIKGSALNNDGALKVSYTAPSVDGQAQVIARAQALSGVGADSISYIETHGTGTSLGDPIEIAALTQAFRAGTQKKGFCAIGSVKTNVGHLDAAAGVTGLIKTVLALQHQEIPPSLHFEAPNPNIDFENSPFYVNSKLTAWNHDGTPRRAGVSSFGIGGTNAHVVLEEAPMIEPSSNSRSQQLLVLSAKTHTALATATTNLVEHVKQHPELNLADVAYTLQNGRTAFNHRQMVVVQNTDDTVNALETLDPKRVWTSYQEPITRDVVFMFPGQGAQYVNMGLELYRTETRFQEQIDTCSEILKHHLDLDLRDILYPDQQDAEHATQKLKNTVITQPALFVIEYALAKLWMSWGVHPTILTGHSIGEYVAACLAGVFSLEDALTLVATRGRLLQETLGGSMLAVRLSEKEIQSFLGEHLSLAVINGPDQCVVSGEKEAVEALEKQLSEKNVGCQQLHTSHAFHSKMVEPILTRFEEHVTKASLNPPQIPILSSVTGTWISSEEIMNPGYWTKNLRQTVRFYDCAQELLRDHDRVLLEVGPGQTLNLLVKQYPEKSEKHIILPSTRHPKDQNSDVAFILNTLGRLWLAGVQPDWAGFYTDEKRHRVPLPTYPFERQRYWIATDRPAGPVQTGFETVPSPSLPQTKKELADWFYVPSWKRSVIPPMPSEEALMASRWLVFVDECGLGAALIQRLELEEQNVTVVRVGETFSRLSDSMYTLNPRQDRDYETLFNELRTLGRTPETILHMWNVTQHEGGTSGLERLDDAQDRGMYSLLAIARALSKEEVAHTFRIQVISNNMKEVTGDEVTYPEKATLLGACKVIPQEYSTMRCRSIDIVSPEPGSQQEAKLVNHLLAEANSDSSDLIVAYRGSHRWVQTVEPVRIDESVDGKTRLRERGVYLIAGGLGGIGLEIAEHLAKNVQAKVILTGRSALPLRDEWDSWLATHQEDDAISHKLRKLKRIEAAGGEVFVAIANVANREQMQDVITQAEKRFGRINGVIHSAGVFDRAGAIHRRTREMTEDVIASKVRGTLILDDILQDTPLDFFILHSSIATALYHGEYGQIGYVAANEFLDAYAYHKTLKDGTFTTTINWDDWQEVGMSVAAYNEFAETYGIRDGVFDPLDQFTPSEGVNIFRRILNHSFSRLLISTRDLRLRIEQDAFAISPFLVSAAKSAVSIPAYPRPEMRSSYVAPSNPYEQTIADTWGELLGIEQVGVQDDFFELGGDSLRATQVLARLREVFQVEMSPSSLFENPTVADLAKRIETLCGTTQQAIGPTEQLDGSFVEGEV